MRKFFTILVCRLAYFLGHLVGRGSSLPGQIALKLYPSILSKIALPQLVIAVTGSNGKTSTVEMITHILQKQGRKVISNREGSNLSWGIAAVVLSNCTLGGRFKGDALVLETDERYAKPTFRYFSPTHFVVTNLYRDQLTRNGHPEWVYDAISGSVPEDCTLILNADDPLVSRLGKDRENVVWFGMDRQPFSVEANTSVYDDGAFCPVCKSRMRYTYRHYNHIGEYFCDGCGHRRQPAEYSVTGADLQNGVITVNNDYNITLSFKSVYNVYNILACFAACVRSSVPPETAAADISDYVLKSGRVVEYELGESSGTFLVSKHENSVSYDQSIRYILDRNERCGVIIIVDAVSRRYSTGEISWLWDIDFELLNAECVEHVYLLGAHAPDLETRFSYTSIPSGRITAIPDIEAAVNEIAAKKHERLYTVTCFSDKAKFLSKVTVK